MNFRRRFFANKHAHIPFSVIGVFLIIGSTFTTVYVSKLEQEKSLELVSTLDVNEIEHILRYAEADIARMLNYAGMYALEYIGQQPVTYSELESAAAQDYADGVEVWTENPDYIDSENEAVQFNMNWARNITRVKINEYLETNFMHNRFEQHDFSINVKTLVNNWRDIAFQEIPMRLTRDAPFDLMITEEDNRAGDEIIYDTYWEASVDIEIILTDLSSGEQWEFTIHPSSIITSRLPLLMGLTYTYHDTISGVEGDFFGNKLQILVTLISEVYTEARSLVQWSSGPTKIKNIVDNTWLKYVVNAGITAEQFIVFNSVDPMSLIDLIVHAKDLAGDSDPMGDIEDKQDLLQSGVSFLIDAGEDVFKTLEKEGIDRENASEMINNLQNFTNESTMMQASIGNLSENLLYEVDYIYYYYNGTNVVEKDKTFYENNRYDFTSSDGKRYVLGDLDNKVFDRVPNYNTINQPVLDEIETTIENAYIATLTTDVSRSKHGGYEHGWLPGVHHGVPDKLLSSSGWTRTACYNTSSDPLAAGDILPSLLYTESWKAIWNKTETWEICDNYNVSCDCCNESHTEQHTYIQEHDLLFTIDADYPPDDVADVFYQKIIFGAEPHPDNQTDDNLEVLRSEYPPAFITLRDTVLNSRTTSGQVDETNYQYDDGANYMVGWLQGVDGCAVEALKNITELIKDDEKIYGKISEEFKKYSRIEDMDKGRQALLDNFSGRRSIYVNMDYYEEGSDFTSAGAKVVARIREWFINQIEDALSESPTDMITEEIAEQLGTDGEKKLQDYDKMKEDYGDVLGNLGSIQFGLAMHLERESSGTRLGWTEDVALAVDQYPNYLLFHPKKNESGGDEPWYFNIKNICLFGPTGLPLLPIGVLPWIVTINVWPIEVDGAYERFKLVDTLDETHVNPLFGHSGQVYQRQKSPVEDKLCSGQKIGRTNSINFDFWTLNFAIVPPSRLPIGDQNFDEIVEYTDHE